MTTHTLFPLLPLDRELLSSLLTSMRADGWPEAAAEITVGKDNATGPAWAWTATRDAALRFAAIERNRLLAALQTRLAAFVETLPADVPAAAVGVPPARQGSLWSDCG